ncbi:MAG: type II secretion system protein GspN [Deltaproteobacteria bacterium]|nr:type II secretion system protein GspN [Deltaproteobacteria bacterium]
MDISNYPIKKYIGIAVCAVVLIFLVFALTVPAQVLYSMTVKGAEENGVIIKAANVERGYPVGFNATNVSITANGSELRIEELKARISILGFLTGGVKVKVLGSSDEGRISVILRRGFFKSSVQLQIDSLSPSNIKTNNVWVGLGDKGVINAKGSFSIDDSGCPVGAVTLDGKGLTLSSLASSFAKEVTGNVQNVQAEIDFKDCLINVSNLTFYGERSRLTAKGRAGMAANSTEIKVDIIPLMGYEDVLAENALLRQYKKSMNSYTMYVTGSLKEPTVRK